MQTKTFTISINAPQEKVWEILWNDETYRQWTSVFSEGSYAVSNWQQGSKVQFLSADGGGMHSIIERLVPNEVMSFRHRGEIKEGVEQPPSPSWDGATETYMLAQEGTGTRLTVQVDMLEDHANYFEQTFPDALQKVAELAQA